MHFSVAYAALLAVPAALASPLALGLEERATVPTCNANNIQLLRSAHPASKTFCSSWKATSTHAGSGITNSVTSLSPSQVTNLCNCLLAPTYVASPGLTSTTKSGATTSAPATVPTCNANNIQLLRSAHPASKTFCNSWKAVPTHSDSGITNSVTSLTPAQVTNLCNCVLASTYVASPGLTSTTSAATTSGQTTTTTSSGGASTSTTSTSSGAKSSTTVAPSSSSGAVGSTFGLYVKASTATTSASALQASAAGATVGLYPTLVPKKRDVEARQAGCVATTVTVSSSQYTTVCDTGVSVPAAADGVPTTPGAYAKVNSLSTCIAFCDQQGSTNCKAVTWSGSVCTLYKTSFSGITTTSTSGTTFAYLVGPVQPLSFTFDASTGYVYDTQFPGSLLGVSTPVGGTASLILYSSTSGGTPVQCTMASGSLSCSATISGVIYGAWTLAAADSSNANRQVLGLSVGGSSQSTAIVTTGAIPAGASTSSSTTYTSGNNTVLLTTSDFFNSGLNVSTNTVMTSSSADTINITFDTKSSGGTYGASELVADDVALYLGDFYRFTTSISYTYGSLSGGVTCKALFYINDASSGAGYFSTFFDNTLPKQFDIVYEGTVTTSEVSRVAFNLQCSAGSEQVYPVVLSSMKLVSDPMPVGSGINITLPGATANTANAWVQYYSGSNSRAVVDSTTAPISAIINSAVGTEESVVVKPVYAGDQAAAVKACATLITTSPKTGFQVYYQKNSWQCAVFGDNYASTSLFNIADPSITQVVGYYWSAALTGETNKV